MSFVLQWLLLSVLQENTWRKEITKHKFHLNKGFCHTCGVCPFLWDPADTVPPAGSALPFPWDHLGFASLKSASSRKPSSISLQSSKAFPVSATGVLNLCFMPNWFSFYNQIISSPVTGTVLAILYPSNYLVK